MTYFALNIIGNNDRKIKIFPKKIKMNNPQLMMS